MRVEEEEESKQHKHTEPRRTLTNKKKKKKMKICLHFLLLLPLICNVFALAGEAEAVEYSLFDDIFSVLFCVCVCVYVFFVFLSPCVLSSSLQPSTLAQMDKF